MPPSHEYTEMVINKDKSYLKSHHLWVTFAFKGLIRENGVIETNC